MDRNLASCPKETDRCPHKTDSGTHCNAGYHRDAVGKADCKAKTGRLSREEQWEARLECVKVYQKVHGTLDIPAKYKTEDGFWLGRWWYLQKKMLREEPGKLRLEQTEKLEEVLEGERKKALPESA